MEYQDARYLKHVFLIGDIHCNTREKSLGGSQVTNSSKIFFDLLSTDKSYFQDKVPIFWEIPANGKLYDKSNLYIHRQAKKLINLKKDRNCQLVLTPSDTLRKVSPILRKLMFLSLAKPGIAKIKLDDQGFRRKARHSLETIFLPKSRTILEQKFARANRQQSLPHHIRSSLKQNLKWHKQQVMTLKQNLSYPPNRIFAEDLAHEFKINLSQTTADLEFLVNIFSHKSNIILVYAGNGHIKRLQKFLYKLGFKASFEIENMDFLDKVAFDAFAKDLKNTSFFVEKSKPLPLEKSPYITI